MPFFAKGPRGKHARGAHAKGGSGNVSHDSASLRQNKHHEAGNRAPKSVSHVNNQGPASRNRSFNKRPNQSAPNQQRNNQASFSHQNQAQSPYAGYVSRLRPSGGQTASTPAQNTTRMPSQVSGGNTRASAGNAYTTPTVRPMYQQSGGWQPVGTSQAPLAVSPTSPEPPKKKSKKWRVIFVISLIVLVASLAALGAIAYQYWSQQQAYEGLESYVEVTDQEAVSLSDLSVDWAALQEVNPDVVAWIYIPGTPVSYPIVQGADNDEYLHRAFDGSTGWLASAGTIFLDSINDKALSDQNNALYGHHMNDGSMFASVADWVDADTFNSQRDIYIMTPEGNYRLKTFAVVKTVGSDAIVETTFSSKVQFVNYIQDKIDRSVVAQEGTVLQAHDVKQSFLLSTCEYSRDDGRVVAFAAVVETTVAGNPYLNEVEEGSTGITQDQAGSIAQAA